MAKQTKINKKRTVTFLDALKEIGDYRKVTCTVDNGSSVTYQVRDGELTVNGRIKDMRDFCFAATQVLYGDWTVES